MTEPSVKFSSGRRRQRGHQPARSPGAAQRGLQGRGWCPEKWLSWAPGHTAVSSMGTLLGPFHCVCSHDLFRSSHWSWERGLAGTAWQELEGNVE